MNNLLLFAHPLEAHATIARLHATPLLEGRLYRFSQGRILITGMGSLEAALQVSHLAQPQDRLLNLGIAGGLKKKMKRGSLYWVREISCGLPPSQAHSHSRALYNQIHPPLSLQKEGESLCSTPLPIWGEDPMLYCPPGTTLIDMEGYGMARAALHLKLPFAACKLLSDFCEEGGFRALKEKLPAWSEKLADVAEEWLTRSYADCAAPPCIISHMMRKGGQPSKSSSLVPEATSSPPSM